MVEDGDLRVRFRTEFSVDVNLRFPDAGRRARPTFYCRFDRFLGRALRVFGSSSTVASLVFMLATKPQNVRRAIQTAIRGAGRLTAKIPSLICSCRSPRDARRASCVTTRSVLLRSRARLSSRSIIVLPVFESRFPVGSSAKIMSGSWLMLEQWRRAAALPLRVLPVNDVCDQRDRLPPSSLRLQLLLCNVRSLRATAHFQRGKFPQ